MSKLLDIINHTMGLEGGVSDHAADKGGLTKYGITQATWSAAGYPGAVSAATPEQARAIYMKNYIQQPGFAPIVDISDAVCAELFDTGVNMGPVWATRFLQRALNALRTSGSSLTVDGKMGPASLAALKDYLKSRPKDGESNLLKALNSLQAVRYIEIVENNPSQKAFINGWLGQRVVI